MQDHKVQVITNGDFEAIIPHETFVGWYVVRTG